MAPLPDFDEDVFISYAQIDNQRLDEGLKGWVETLHERLRIRLEQLTGEAVRVWRDRSLQGNDIFAESLVEHLTKAAVLVSVLSPRYVKSEWCMRELREFCDHAESHLGLNVGDKSRVFKVLKLHVPLEEHPPQLRGSLGYEFFEYDRERERAREFSPDVTPARDIRYWEKLEDLAYDITQTFKTMRRASGSLSATAAPGGEPKTVYLSETTSDLVKERDLIKRELQLHGHVVLPDRELPLRGEELRAAVREYLGRSELSVHLLGGSYGVIPEDEEQSLAEIQSELAEERGESLRRIVWLPTGVAPRNPRQQQFLDHFRLGLNGQRGTEVLQTSLEDLKKLIEERVSAKPRQPEAAGNGHAGDESPASVYLICDKDDFGEVAPVEDYIYERGMNVILPAVEGDETSVREDHKANLIDCDAVMLYYGRGNDIWLRMKQRELQKAAGYGRTKPLLAKAIYVTGPPTPSKERVRDLEALVIRNFDKFSPEPLQPFLEKVRQGKGERA